MAEAVNGNKEGDASTPFLRELSLRRWLLMSSTDREGNFYKEMFAKCPAGRPGTSDEVADLAQLIMDSRSSFITGSDFLIDGGATASYFYGPLQPKA